MLCTKSIKKTLAKLFFSVVFILLFCTPIFAQSLTHIDSLYIQKNLAEAKEAVDIFCNENDTDEKGHLLKAKIYVAIEQNVNFKYLSADGKTTAFNALKKATALNASYLNQQLQKDNFALPFLIYNGFSNEGIATFNTAADSKNTTLYLQALQLFKKAIQVSSFIKQNNWGASSFDTTNIYYAAKCGIYGLKEDEAQLYSKKIADAQIIKIKDNLNVESVYEWLVYYYRTKQNIELLTKYTNLGNTQFPTSTFFRLNLMDYLRGITNYQQLFTEYSNLFAKGFNKKEYQFTYLADLYNYIYLPTDTVIKTSYKALFEKKAAQFLKSNATDISVRLLLAKYYTNQAADFKKQKFTNAKIISSINKANIYLSDITDKLRNVPPTIYKEAVGLLVKNLRVLGKGELAGIYEKRIL